MAGTESDVMRNRQAQTEVYGEPLNALLGRCGAVLGLTQGRIAGLLGVSAPMLSQLINGHRAKLGNPAASRRLEMMRDLLIDVEAGRIGVAEATAQLERNRDADVFTMTTQHEPGTVREVQELFRATASAADFLAAAEQLQDEQPEIAELLRTYGASRTDQAVEHFRRTRTTTQSG
jgi:predicted transcriptional regulator